MNLSASLAIIFLVLLATGVYIYEHRKIRAPELALIVSLAAIAGVSRIPFAGIPSVQPATFLVLFSGYVFGPFIGCVVGSMVAPISNFFLLEGPWTVWQMVGWGLVGLSGGVAQLLQMRGQSPKKGTVPWSHQRVLLILGFAWGFLFGWLMNVWYWMTYVYPLNWQSWISVNAASFLFDMAHAVGNVVFILLFGKPLLAVLLRFKNKLSLT
ncbi:MAG: ECF transporter S component [Candidatus Omnitrophica bacterium]|nr:ECF transporter S component [Candidatus Omnitrophota bacterium]